MNTQTNKPFQLIYIFIIIRLIVNFKITNCDLDNTAVELSELPDLFSNEKLLNYSQESDRCFDHIGCIELIPIKFEPQAPSELKTIFQIFTNQNNNNNNNNESIDVPYKSKVNCLKSSTKQQNCNTYPYDLELLIRSKFNPKLRTIIITPGFRTQLGAKWQVDLKDKWLKLENVNVILVSWEGGNFGRYEIAVANTRIVSRQITVLLYYLTSIQQISFNDENFLNKLYLIGHSLGAHISGFVGNDLNGQVGRITGLDPAGPGGFRDIDERYRLDRSDGQFVDALHTNGCEPSLANPCFGLEKPIAHLDYYANDGKHQPHCKFDGLGCSHGAATEYYEAFLDHELYIRENFNGKGNDNDKHRFLATLANNYEEFQNGSSLMKSFHQLESSLNSDSNPKKKKTQLFSNFKECSIPIDYIKPFELFRQELETNYKFELNNEESKRYFFLTSSAIPYINNQNVIKILVNKNDTSSSKDDDDDEKICDIVFNIKMASGAWIRNEVKNYKLIDQDDHYEIIVPYVSTDTASKYELVKLKSNEFYLNDVDKDFKSKLQLGIRASFSNLVEIIEFFESNKRKNELGLMGSFKDLLGITANKDDQGHNNGKCNLQIETLTIQPLNAVNFQQVALTYSVFARENEEPKYIILNSKENEEEEENSRLESIDHNYETNSNLKLFIDKVFIDHRP